MDAQITLKRDSHTIDITTSVIAYTREQSLCSGIGQLRVEVAMKRLHELTKNDYPTLPSTGLELWDELRIYEGGHHKGTYFVHTIDVEWDSRKAIATCQDGSLRLQDYFIDTPYYIDYYSNSDYWITLFLDMAGVSYQFESGIQPGSPLSNNTSLGMTNALEAIQGLLHQNAWYMYFTASNVAYIGRIPNMMGEVQGGDTENQPIHITSVTQDSYFRNRAVVWGNSDPTTGAPIFADVDYSTLNFENQYSSDGTDKRTVVLMNSAIPSVDAAYAVAKRAVTEFTQIPKKVTIDFAGHKNISIGDVINTSGSGHYFTGLVTTVGSSLSADGLTTRVILNEKCPRIFGYFSLKKDWVYVGTNGNGVWRKQLDTDLWESFSSGLPVNDRDITDLRINTDVFACVTAQGSLYTRTSFTSWAKQNFSPTENPEFTASTAGKFTCCTIDPLDFTVVAGYTLSGENSKHATQSKSWIVRKPLGRTISGMEFVDVDGEDGYAIVDLDIHNEREVVSTIANYSGINELWNSDNILCYSGINTMDPIYQCYLAASGSTISYNGVYWPVGVSGVLERYYTGNYGLSSNPPEHTFLADGMYYYTVSTTDQFTYTSVSVGIGNSNYVNEETAGIGNVYFNLPFGASHKLALAIGNKVVAIPYEDNYGETCIELVDFRDSSRTTAHTGFYNSYPIASTMLSDEGGRKVFILLATNDSQNLTLVCYDPDQHFTYKWAESTGSSFHGATFYSFSYLERRGAVSGDNLVFTVYSYYDEETYGMMAIPSVVVVPKGGGLMQINNAVGDTLFSTGGFLAVDNVFYYRSGAIDGAMCVAFESEYYEGEVFTSIKQILKIGGSSSSFIYGPADGEYVIDVISGQQKLYFVVYTGTSIKIINGETGAVSKTIAKDRSEVKFIEQVDDRTGNIYYYDLTTYNLVSVSISNEDTFEIPLLVRPPSDPYQGHDPEYNYGYSAGFLLHDVCYLELVGSFTLEQFYYRTSTSMLYPYVSGIRSISGEYFKFRKDDAIVLGGDEFSGYEEVYDPHDPLQLEASSSFSPFLLYGGTVYSGLAISGTQTGYNQGQLLFSFTGEEGTFNQVILNGLHSYVPDVRHLTYLNTTATLPSGYQGMAPVGSYLVFPQSETTVLGTGLTSLTVLDINQLAYSGINVISASGTLSNGYVLAQFSGFINHVETTNKPDYPYIFCSMSGVPTIFYQKDGYFFGEDRTGFIDMTGNLPLTHEITVIRCDEVL